MFTGIIEEKTRISGISGGTLKRITIQSGLEVKKSESIAIQGICLTVTDYDNNNFTVEAMKQTKNITTSSYWRVGDYVNIERALMFGERMGGHFLLGHVDEVGRLLRIKENEYFFQSGPKNIKFLIKQGSIGIDGVSLTITSISKNIFSVSLIPYTLKQTTLGNLKIGSLVNIEYDYLAKIVVSKIS